MDIDRLFTDVDLGKVKEAYEERGLDWKQIETRGLGDILRAVYGAASPHRRMAVALGTYAGSDTSFIDQVGNRFLSSMRYSSNHQLNAQFISLGVQRMRMSSDSDSHVEAESTINDSYGTTIPAPIRHALDDALEPGDTVRWMISDGELSLEIVHEEYGAFEDAEPFDGPAWESDAAAESAWSE